MGSGKVRKPGLELGTPKRSGAIYWRATHKDIGTDIMLIKKINMWKNYFQPSVPTLCLKQGCPGPGGPVFCRV